jgi:DNA-binding SARP family transcriptional activator/DNA-binding beta-propeller fold protein YncE
MEFRILGPLEVLDDEGRPVPLRAGHMRKLLAVLLLHGNEAVSCDGLIDALWGETPPRTAAKALQGYVSQLRKELARAPGGRPSDETLVTRPPGYAVCVDPDRLDALRFARMLAEARRASESGDAARAAETLRRALALWRGPALAEFAFDEFARAEILRLEALHLDAREERIAADMVLGRHAEVVGELRALVGEQPLRETLRGRLMLALYRSGRQADALHEYRQARRYLVEELGIEPGEELRRLERAILAHDAALTPAAAHEAAGSPRARASGRNGRDDAPYPADSVVMIDARSARVVGHVPVGRRPVALASGHGAVWVANADDGTVSRIDPTAGRVTRTIGIGAPAIDLATGPDAVWVANGSDGTVACIDPHSEAVITTIDLRGPSDLLVDPVYAVSAGYGAVWVASGPRSVLRIDPTTDVTVAAIEVGHVPVDVVVGLGVVWVVTIAGRALRIEPRTNSITAEASIGSPVAAAVGEDSLWLADVSGCVWRLDPDTVAVKSATTVGTRLTGVLVGADSVWVADSAAGAVRRLDPRTGQVVGTLEVGHAPSALALAEGVLWVALQEGPVI